MPAESDANRAVVSAFFETAEKGGDVLSFLDCDASWWVPGHWELGGTYRKEELAPLFDRVFALMDGPLRFTIHAMTAEENRVAVDCEGHGRFKDGMPYDNSYHFLFTLRDGKIIAAKEFLNTAYMSKILTLQLAKAG